MATPQPNAWQTAGRARNSNAASRTPQMRSGTQSPAQQIAPAQPPRQDGPRGQQPVLQPTNVWTQRTSNPSTSNGSSGTETLSSAEEPYQSINGFNTSEVRAFLGRDMGPAVLPYKPVEAVDTSARSSGAWAPKSNHMANNQPFFLHLAKQVDGG